MTIVSRVVGRVGPREPGTSTPDHYIKTAIEIWIEQREAEEAQRKRDAGARNRVRPTATILQISRMEAAIQWQSRYLADTDKYEVRDFALQLRCWAYRWSFRRACEEDGIALSTANDRVDRAMLRIATGLMRDGVLTGEDIETDDDVDEKLGDAGKLVHPGEPAADRFDPPEWWPYAEQALLATGVEHEAIKVIYWKVREEFAGLPRSRKLVDAMERRFRTLRDHMRAMIRNSLGET